MAYGPIMSKGAAQPGAQHEAGSSEWGEGKKIVFKNQRMCHKMVIYLLQKGNEGEIMGGGQG